MEKHNFFQVSSFVTTAVVVLAALITFSCTPAAQDAGQEGSLLSVITEREVIGGPSTGRPYSPAIKTTTYQPDENGNPSIISQSLYVSGQIAIDPETGEGIRDSIEAETDQVLMNIRRLVQMAGFEMSNAVRCTVFLADINDYEAMNSVYLTFFPENPPSRECVAVKEIVRGYRVEISLIAQK